MQSHFLLWSICLFLGCAQPSTHIHAQITAEASDTLPANPNTADLAHFYDYLDGLHSTDLRETEDDPDIYIVAKNKKFGLVDTAGKILLPLEYEHILELRYMVVFKKNGRYGFLSHTSKISSLRCLYEDYIPSFYIPPFTAGDLAFFVKQNGLWGTSNDTGQLITPCRYETIGALSGMNDEEPDGNPTSYYLTAKKNNQWGIITEKGEIIIPFEYDSIQFSGYNNFTVKKNQKYGLISQDTIFCPIQYDSLIVLPNDLVLALQDGFWGVLHQSDSRQNIPFIYKLYQLKNRRENKKAPNGYYLEKDSKYGLIVPYSYPFRIKWLKKNPFLTVPKKNKSNNYPPPPEVTDTHQNDEDSPYEIRREANKYGLFYHKTKKLSVPIEYDSLILVELSLSFSGSSSNKRYFLYARKGEKWGVIDTKNAKILDIAYEDICDFHETADVFVVLKNGYYGLVNAAGQELSEFKYPPLQARFLSDIFSPSEGGNWGLTDRIDMQYTVFLEWDWRLKKWVEADCLMEFGE